MPDVSEEANHFLLADLGSEIENAGLSELISDEIRRSGPITFERFMQLALYHPSDGYYCSSRRQIGAGGDYLTSPEISPLFGYAIARQIAELWRSLGAPPSFDLVEVGAGNGTLARDVLRWSAARDPAFYAALRYRIVELSGAMRARQEALLERWLQPGRLSINERIEQFAPGGVEGCILANELIDSFPVHRVRVEQGRLLEVYVDFAAGRFAEQSGELSTPAIAEYFDRLGLLPGEGCTAEVNLAGPVWLRAAARALRRGYLLLLDYGYAAERLYAPWRRAGTLLSYHRHEANDDPYVRVGRQDMTTHVDFTTLSESARERGLTRFGLTDQRHFLANLGIGEAVRLDTSRDLGVEEFFTRRRAVAELLDADGLGRVGVLLFGTGVASPPGPLSGFAGAGETGPGGVGAGAAGETHAW
jgi:SAM-dependent MidA family methyltransferase